MRLLIVLAILFLAGCVAVEARPVVINQGDISYNTQGKILTHTVTRQQFKVISSNSTHVQAEFIGGGHYLHEGEPPGPLNPFYKTITEFSSTGHQWEHDCVDLVNQD